MEISRLLEQTASVDVLNQIAQNALPQVSFWGSRYTTFTNPDYEGTLHIDDLTARVIQLAKDRGFEFTADERRDGRNLADWIIQLYDQSDDLVDQSNCFTRFLVGIREIISGIFAKKKYGYYLCQATSSSYTRWIWMDRRDSIPGSTYDSIFNLCPIEQYRREFGHSPEEPKLEYPDHEYNRVGPPLYFIPLQHRI